MKEIKEIKTNIQCPNCWGYQEYEGTVISMVPKNTNPSGWIIKYVKKFLTVG